MKRIILLAVGGVLFLSASAQKKKEMAAQITELETQVTELASSSQEMKGKIAELTTTTQGMKENIASLTAKLEQTNTLLLTLSQQLATATSENAALKSRLAKLEGVAKPGQIPDVLTSQDDSLQYAVLQFRMSKTPEEASKYIYDATRVKPIMLKYYTDRKNWEPFSRNFDGSVWNDEATPTQKVNDKVYIFNDTWYLVKTPTGYLVEWEASVNYNESPYLQDYKKPGKTIEVRARWNKDSYYESKYYEMYEGRSEGVDGGAFQVYTNKNSALAIKLQRFLKAKTKGAILKVKCDYDLDGETPVLNLVDVVSESSSKVK